MSQREMTLNWLRDLLEQMTESQKQMEWTTDRTTVRILTEKMLRDLESCRRLCESIVQRGRVPHSVS